MTARLPASLPVSRFQLGFHELGKAFGFSKAEQIAKFCEAFFGIRLADCLHYTALTELQKIRDCIIHCFGDVNLSSDKDFLVKLAKKRPGFIAHPNCEIHVRPECIRQFLTEIRGFFVSVFDTLGWRIATDWQGNRLEKALAKLKK